MYYFKNILAILFFLTSLNLSAMDPPPYLSICTKACGYLKDSETNALEVLRHLAKFHFQEFILAVKPLVPAKLWEMDEDLMFTSCTNTFYALAFVFLDQKKAIPFIDHVNRGFYMKPRKILNDNSLRFSINIFGGFLKSQIQAFGYDEFYALELEIQNNLLRDIFRMRESFVYEDFIEPKINEITEQELSDAEKIEEIRKCFATMSFTDNGFVIENLRETILANNKKLNTERSFVYFIVIHTNTAVEHACVLMQSLKDGEPWFWLLQSYIQLSTLHDEIENQEEGWSLSRLEEFLSALNSAYDPASMDAPVSLESCFGHNVPRRPFSLFTDDMPTWSFRGLVLSFSVFKFKPSDCLFNLQQFLRENRKEQ